MLGLFKSTTIPALEQSLTFSERRHELLAGNIANLDTPGYRSRDLDESEFQNALAESIQDARRTRPTDSIGAVTRDDIYAGPRAASEQVVFHDGSDVSLEGQITEVAKNQHLHGLAITTMRSQFSLLRAAITERA
ncbi:flagellar basal-body rod protein FlgB [Rhodopirellula maiorica SM1]|uniref:Flagellar basal body rod protein FlgB n=1 Tax=Rhodopirellula maiorica SM1 TaxID=1265738 RepID=M5S274_9BACT|nr:flagellar biosynthesis protein FlgB [Rhodopirellula maiorica]EMI21732.1 flagellar basal-body rod protein FlgB [Rhodopirellula maiorica SM1]